MKAYPSTSFSGATAFVQIAGSIGSTESGGSCTMMPWIVESLFNSSTALRTLTQKCNNVSAKKSVVQNFKGITLNKLLKLSCRTAIDHCGFISSGRVILLCSGASNWLSFHGASFHQEVYSIMDEINFFTELSKILKDLSFQSIFSRVLSFHPGKFYSCIRLNYFFVLCKIE